MKKVIFGDELEKKKKDAIDLICNAVASTIGPIGNNVLINSDETLPYITNDGVTIAKAIESDDEEINGILDIIKNAAFKTNEEVGDGTSTTLVLVKSLYDEGIKLINKLGSNKTDYDKFISKILKEYDRLVAETKSLPLFDKYNIMEINGFNELLDVRDNLKLPIMYYNVTMHQKAYFYIVYGKNLYLYTVKSSDFSEK